MEQQLEGFGRTLAVDAGESAGTRSEDQGAGTRGNSPGFGV